MNIQMSIQWLEFILKQRKKLYTIRCIQRIVGMDEKESDEILKNLTSRKIDLHVDLNGQKMLLQFGIIEARNIKV